MKTLISIDPGVSSGLVVGTYSDTEPFQLTHSFQITGGVEGFLKRVGVSETEDMIHEHHYSYLKVDRKTFSLESEDYLKDPCPKYPNCPDDGHACVYDTEITSHATVICEKFTARGSANQFQYKTNDLEPLRIEGAILALGLNPIWVSPQVQYFSGGKDRTEKKKLQHRWLKENGLYIAPKDVQSTDADDARAALAHAISWLRRQKHMPTIEKYFPKTEESND